MEIKSNIRLNIEKQINLRETLLSPYACKSSCACQYYERSEDLRPAFFHDVDKIIHSRCYSRYIDKTQVFYLIENDHITHRVLHVQLVSKIARTIGLFLNLNEDLIEAIALGHDVGHTPFGHNGERIISEFCQKHGCGFFEHNVQSFLLFHEIEKKGEGLNMSVQVLDGIICHNGEILSPRYEYDESKTKEKLLEEYNRSIREGDVSKRMRPMTLEGCVVRVSDIIAYIGRDIEDAIKLNLIDRKDIPRARNYKNIYDNDAKKVQDGKIKGMFTYVLDKNLECLSNRNTQANIFKWLKRELNHSYVDKYPDARIVADYVSGMTDDYLMNTFREMILPKSFGITFNIN